MAVTSALAGVACSASEASSSSAAPSAGTDGGAEDGASRDDAAALRPAPVFLEPSAFADLVTIDARLPFGVTRMHAADDAIVGSHWGRHGGPMITTGVYGASGAASPRVVQWSLPDDPTAPATSKSRPITNASGVPAMHFLGADGMVDLPSGSLSLLSYTTSASGFPGEALLYSPEYDQVTARAKVNGFYSGAGVADVARSFLLYSGLSVLAPTSSAVDNGLYVAEICEGALVAPAPCPASKKLFGWKGASGPVVTDIHGNAFVGASLTGAATSDAVLAVARAQAVSGAAATPATLAAVDSQGTASLAAIAPAAAAEGWVLGLGFDPASAVYAAAYREGDGVLTRGSALVTGAVVPARGVLDLSVFSDSEGDLWLAVAKGKAGVFLELRRKP